MGIFLKKYARNLPQNECPFYEYSIQKTQHMGVKVFLLYLIYIYSIKIGYLVVGSQS